MRTDDASRQRAGAKQGAMRDRMSSDLALPVTQIRRDERSGVSQCEPIKIAMNTPSLTPVVCVAMEDVADAKIEMSWPLVRAQLRKAIKLTTYAAIGSAFAWLALLDARGQVHGKEIHHGARVAEVNAIQFVLSTEETLGLKSPPPGPPVVTAIDAPWTPEAADAKPWTPAPYASIQLPSAPAASAATATIAPKKSHTAKSKKRSRRTP